MTIKFVQASKPLVQGRALLNYKIMRFMKRQDIKLTAGSRLFWTGDRLSNFKLVRSGHFCTDIPVRRRLHLSRAEHMFRIGCETVNILNIMDSTVDKFKPFIL